MTPIDFAVQAVLGIFAIILTCLVGAVFASWPGWLLGRLSYKRDRTAPFFIVFLRRRFARAAALLVCMIALIATLSLAERSFFLATLAIIPWALLNCVSYTYGYLQSSRRDARKNEHLYQALPEGYGEQNFTVNPYAQPDQYLLPPPTPTHVEEGRILPPHAQHPTDHNEGWTR